MNRSNTRNIHNEDNGLSVRRKYGVFLVDCRVTFRRCSKPRAGITVRGETARPKRNLPPSRALAEFRSSEPRNQSISRSAKGWFKKAHQDFSNTTDHRQWYILVRIDAENFPRGALTQQIIIAEVHTYRFEVWSLARKLKRFCSIHRNYRKITRTNTLPWRR